MGDENHHPEEKDQRVPVDYLVGLCEGDDARQHHRDGAAERGSGAVKMASPPAFDGDEQIRDQKNYDGDPMVVRERCNEI